ncbi:MAG: hypothetical protein RLZZ210_227 [Pseudomonadota bacterium]|jgi:arginyl-tRNA synthetase
MLLTQQQKLIESIFNAVISLNFEIVTDSINLEATKNKQHGDISCNVAMKLASQVNTSGQKSNPREIATNIINILKNDSNISELIDKFEIAGPGFINFFLTNHGKTEVVKEILKNNNNFGYSTDKSNESVIVEFVSANPTGPLHVGHGRQAALGDCISSILKTQGYKVYKEFYYNDAGVQIENLAKSVYMRAKGYNPNSPEWPESAYNGEYIEDIAQAFIQKQTIKNDEIGEITASGDIDNINDIKKFAVAYLRKEQDIDLKAFSVIFDNYYLESSLYTEGKVEQTVNSLVEKGKTYIQNDEQKGDALYLKTTEYNDDKDRVMRKSDGSYTYFVPDIAYHVTKFKRGFKKAINIQGFDHHGTIARVRAGLQALEIEIPRNYPDYILHKMVTVLKNGQEVKISKRAGSYVTLRDLIEWSGQEGDEGKSVNLQKGRDAVRFFLISRKADTEFVFDVDMALKQNEENPVYYIQYAHARISSILKQSFENDTTANYTLENQQANNVLSLLGEEHETNLLNKLSWYPHILKQSAQDMTPHNIAFYLRDLSSLFHSFYSHCKVLVENQELKFARLLLLQATKQVINNGLQLLGVSAPEKM